MKSLELKLKSITCNSIDGKKNPDHFYLIGVTVIDNTITRAVAFETKPVKMLSGLTFNEPHEVVLGYNRAFINKHSVNNQSIIFTSEIDDDSKVYFYVMAFDEYLQNTWRIAPENCSRISEEIKLETDRIKLKNDDIYSSLIPVVLDSISKSTPYDSENYLKERFFPININCNESNAQLNFKRNTELINWDYDVEIEVICRDL